MDLSLVVLAVQEEEGARSGLEAILPAPAELFYGAVAFFILFVVLARVAFPRINQALDERQAAIQGRLEEAEQRLNEAEDIRRQYERQIAEARSEANRIIEEARQTGEALRRDIEARAQQEAERIAARAHEEVAAERDRAIQALREQVGDISVQLAAKIVEKELDPSQHQALIERYVRQLAGSN